MFFVSIPRAFQLPAAYAAIRRLATLENSNRPYRKFVTWQIMRAPIRVASAALVLYAVFGLFNCVGAQSHLSEFIRNTPKASTEIIAIVEPAAHLEALLGNKALQRVMTSDRVQGFPNSENMQPEKLSEMLQATKPFYPKHIVFAGTDSIYATFQDVLEFFFRLNLAITINDAAVKVPAHEMTQLTEELYVIVQRLRMPSLTVTLDWDDDSTASMVFSTLNSQLSSLRQQFAIKIRNEESTTRVRAKVSNFLDLETASQFVSAIGLQDKNDEMIKAFVDIDIELQIDRIEKGIRISLGAFEPTFMEAGDLKTLVERPNLICFGQWNLARLEKFREEFKTAFAKWEASEIGKAFREFDTEDTWNTFRSLVRELEKVPRAGSWHVWRTENRIESSLISLGVKTAGNLVDHEILRFIPPDIEAFYLDATGSLTLSFAASIEAGEERIAQNSIVADLSGETEKSKNFDSLTNSYYGNFMAWRDIVLNQLPGKRSTPWVTMGTSAGKLQAFELDLTLLDGIVMRGADVDIPQVAAVAKIDEGSDIPALVDQAYRTFADAVIETFEANVVESLSTTVSADLDLGVPTTEFSLDWLDESSVARIEIRGDFRPHYFVTDGFLVVSTSPILSKRILDRQRNSLQLQSAKNNQLVSVGKISGKSLGFLITCMSKILFDPMVEPGIGDKSSINKIDNVFGFMADVIGLMKMADWRTTQIDKAQTTEITLEFVTE